jgi:hypothetical protein
MNSYWIEQQARQRIDEFVADAHGDRLARDAAMSHSGRGLFGRRPALRLPARLDALVVRSRRPVARAR